MPGASHWPGATSLLQRNGTLGLIATNTVAQGDSREVGLDAIVAAGFTITRAIQSRSWPSASAHLEFAAVWGTRADVAAEVPRIADGIEVRLISTLLEPAGRATGNPIRLGENAGMAFQGCIVLGMGFVIEEEEAQEWIAADARNADVLFPYLNGEDLNSRPDNSPSRWVIDFGTREQAAAAQYQLPYDRVLRLVKPERDKLKLAHRRDYWWRFAAWAPSLRTAISGLSEVLVLAQVSNTAQPVLIPNGIVPSHKLVVFASNSRALLAILASSIHYVWARKYSGAIKNDLSYSPSDVFLTFPRPPASSQLEVAGAVLHQERREIMLRRALGLTKTYNLVNDSSVVGDPDVDRLREIQVEVDLATAEAYGWSDVRLDHGFHVYRQITRWTLSAAARIEIIDRLLEENGRRAASEKQHGMSTRRCRQGSEGDTLFE